jgi:DNA polymerase-3 subunit delta
VKVDATRIQTFYRHWPDDVRLVMLYGPDVAASRDHADQIARQFADAANPMAVDAISGGTLAKDPQALVGAAGAVSMFGDRTLVRVDGLDEDCLAAVAQLLDAPPGNPVVAVGGAFKKGSKLVALAEKSLGAAILQSYEPALRDALRLATEIGTPLGLRASREAATALFEAAGGDRTLIRRELEKLSLYLDSGVDRPKPLERSDVEAIGVGVGDADQFALGAAVASGRPAQVVDLLGRLPAGMGIPALRAVERRFALLLTLRAVVDGGASPQTAVDSARPPIFWKEKDAVAGELGLWSTLMVVRALADLLRAERDIKASGSLGDIVAHAAILLLARRAAARRQ